jgi:hypothetical protein
LATSLLALQLLRWYSAEQWRKQRHLQKLELSA